MKKLTTLLSVSCLMAFLAVGCAKDQKHTPKSPTDNEISKVMTTINEGEITLAQHVIASSNNKEVIEFAKHMVKDHSMNNEKTLSLMDKIDGTPVESDKSQAMMKDGEMSKTMLLDLKGPELDKAYIADQIATHQNVLEELNTNLIPSAVNPELKTHLEMTADKVEEHLNHAREIQSKLI